jgi:hypothetical protein
MNENSRKLLVELAGMIKEESPEELRNLMGITMTKKKVSMEFPLNSTEVRNKNSTGRAIFSFDKDNNIIIRIYNGKARPLYTETVGKDWIINTLIDVQHDLINENK